jgi:hypothetical protein
MCALCRDVIGLSYSTRVLQYHGNCITTATPHTIFDAPMSLYRTNSSLTGWDVPVCGGM